MSVITVCRQPACLACETTARVADTLGFGLVDQEVFHRVADEMGVSEMTSQEPVYEGCGDLVEQVALNDLVVNTYEMPSFAADRIVRACRLLPTRNYD